ncbi:hypothetical protein Ahy_A02g005254 [Arachis hypogaea]|uniref:Aminotransferase-like plant mobile domain-containing protein n=1 Tax=Arachis hypogaea TaxID=3818 RepID=A0A445E644_ARAHY|nr:hypothetical protein Ahy_A02g005254 [Arachis hypogaea]
MRRQQGMRLDERYVPYLQMAGLYHLARLNDKWFQLDEPLVSAFVERWGPETHTFHMPFGECTITLQDVAYHLGLPVDGHYETFEECPEGADEETVRRFARAYIMMLLGTQLFTDKSGNRIHIRWLPYVARLEEMGGYSWGSAALAWLYRCMCRVANRHIVKLAGPLQLLQSWIFWRFSRFRPDGFDLFSWPLASSEKGPWVQMTRLRINMLQPRDFLWMPYSTPEVVQVVHPEVLESRHTALWRSVTSLIYFAVVEWHQVDRVLPQFGGVQARPRPALNIDFLMLKDGRGVPDMDIVDDVPDRRRVDRRARVGTRRSDREWRWLDHAIEDGKQAGRARGGARRRGGRRRGAAVLHIGGDHRDDAVAGGAAHGGVIPDAGGAAGELHDSVMGHPSGHVDAGLGEGPLGDYFVGVPGDDHTLHESTPWVSPGTMYSDFLADDGLDAEYGGDHFLDEITAIMQEDKAARRTEHFALGGTPPSAACAGSQSVVGPFSSRPLHIQPLQDDEEDDIEDEELLIRRGHRTWVPRRYFTGSHLFR